MRSRIVRKGVVGHCHVGNPVGRELFRLENPRDAALFRAAGKPVSLAGVVLLLYLHRTEKAPDENRDCLLSDVRRAAALIATELGKALAARGHQIHLISYALPMRLEGFQDNIYYHEVEMSSYPLFEFPLYTPALASKIVEVARFEKLDLVHAHYAIPHAISAYLAREIAARKS